MWVAKEEEKSRTITSPACEMKLRYHPDVIASRHVETYQELMAPR